MDPPPTKVGPDSQRNNILLLMCDSMDGRILDPTSPVSRRVHMPHLREMAADGLNFVKAYTPSPQCGPARTAMLTGRRTDQTRCFDNGDGLSADPSGALDRDCVQNYENATCLEFARDQQIRATFFDDLVAAGLDVAVFGKVHVGASLASRYGPMALGGFGGGPSLPTLTRSFDVRRPIKANPLSTEMLNDRSNSGPVHDMHIIDGCVDWLHGKRPSSPRWFLYWCMRPRAPSPLEHVHPW